MSNLLVVYGLMSSNLKQSLNHNQFWDNPFWVLRKLENGFKRQEPIMIVKPLKH